MIKDSERIEELEEEINNLKGEISILEDENYLLDRKNSYLEDMKDSFENLIMEMYFNFPELKMGRPYQKVKLIPTDDSSCLSLEEIRRLYETI